MPDLKDDLFSYEEVEAFTKKVFQGAFKNGSFDKQRVNAYAQTFGKAIEKGFKKGGGSITVDFDTPDTKMLNALRDNVFHFSAAKNRTEIEAMSAALRDDKGKLRSFNDFAKEARKVTDEFQGRYMKTEYNLAVNASTMAARWAEFEDDAVLVYETAHDNRVRPAHAALNGIAKPKSDPFWNTYYPPNGWNCRCTVLPTTSGRITPDDQLPNESIDGVPPLFRSNFAKEGLAFPKDHPYFKALDNKKVKSEYNNLSKLANPKELKKWAVENLLNETTTNNSIKAKINFNVTGIKEFINQPYKFENDKASILKNIPEIIRNAKYMGWRTMFGNPMITKSHILEIMVNKEKSWIVLRENIKGEVVFYSISDNKTILNDLKR